MSPKEGFVSRLKRWVARSTDVVPSHHEEAPPGSGVSAPAVSQSQPVKSPPPKTQDLLAGPLSILNDLPAKDDFRLLIEAVLPAAKLYLDRPDLFYPFGAQINLDGTVDHVVGSTGEKNPAADEVVKISLDGFKAAAQSGKIRATALVRHTDTIPPQGGNPVPAIQIMLDHLDGISLNLFLPYTEKTQDEFIFTNVFFNQSQQRIFQ